MALVFCRGCGKQIHDSAPACPACGAPQAVPDARGNRERNVGALIALAIVWAAGFWMAGLFLAGAIAGMLNPANAQAAGERAGQLLAAPGLLLAIVVATGMTIAGWLPGTRRPR